MPGPHCLLCCHDRASACRNANGPARRWVTVFYCISGLVYNHIQWTLGRLVKFHLICLLVILSPCLMSGGNQTWMISSRVNTDIKADILSRDTWDGGKWAPENKGQGLARSSPPGIASPPPLLRGCCPLLCWFPWSVLAFLTCNSSLAPSGGISGVKANTSNPTFESWGPCHQTWKPSK